MGWAFPVAFVGPGNIRELQNLVETRGYSFNGNGVLPKPTSQKSKQRLMIPQICIATRSFHSSMTLEDAERRFDFWKHLEQAGLDRRWTAPAQRRDWD